MPNDDVLPQSSQSIAGATRVSAPPDFAVESLEKRTLLNGTSIQTPYLPLKDLATAAYTVDGNDNTVSAIIIKRPSGFTGSIYSIDGAPYDETGMIDLSINGQPNVIDQINNKQGIVHDSFTVTFPGNGNSFFVDDSQGTIGIDIGVLAQGRYNTLNGGDQADYFEIWRASEAFGGTDDNYVDAYGGLDTVFGGGALNNLRSEIGQNFLEADGIKIASGPSTLEGTGGNDTLYGSIGTDPTFMLAHGGNSQFTSYVNGDTLNGGGGLNNTAFIYAPSDVGPTGLTVVGGIENFIIEPFNQGYDPWDPATWPTS